MGKKVLFIDRDGTLIEEPEDFQVDSLEKVRLVRDVIPALLELSQHGYRFVMVSNQDGLGTPSFPQDEFAAGHERTLQLFTSQGVTFDEIFVCPHLQNRPVDALPCRYRHQPVAIRCYWRPGYGHGTGLANWCSGTVVQGRRW